MITLETAAALLLAATPVPAQGSLADYQRARTLPDRSRGTVTRARVRPHWLPGGTRFWYANELGKGRREFVLLDAETGTRRQLFDPERLALALSEASGSPIDKDELSIAALALEGNLMQLWRKGERQTWSCDLQTYDLERHELEESSVFALEPAPGLRRSRRGGPETEIFFFNPTEAPVEIIWLNTTGARRSYGKLEPGAVRRQHSFAGHAWLLLDAKGRDRGRFRALREPRVAIAGAPVSRDGKRGRRSRPAERRGLRAFFKDHDLWLRNLATGKEWPLTTDGSEENAYGGRIHWSPDSRKLLVLQTEKAQEHPVYFVESSPRKGLQPILHTHDYLKPGDRIAHSRPRLFDVDSRKMVTIDDALFPNPWSLTRLRWSPDSERFTFLYNQRGHQVMRVIAVDAETGKTQALVDEECRTFFDYAGKTWLGHLDATRELVWMSERDGWNHLYLYDAGSGRVKKQITKGRWVVRRVDRLDEKERRIWFWAGGIVPGQDPYYLQYCRVNLDGTGLTVLTKGDGTHEVSFSPDRRFFIDTFSRVDLPPVSVLRRAEDGELVRELERGDWSALLATGWKPPERFLAKGRDGETDIYGVILRPSNFDPKRRYPVVEAIYAGPHGAHVPKAFKPWHRPQAIAELGFVVVRIDGMGTSHRSKAFHDVCWKNLADSGFPDRILWIRAAARRYPYMDLSRVGIYGGSAGGQSALRALLAHGDFYKVAVSDCGCHDNRMDKIWWNELWMGWPVGPHYAEQSNVTNAHRLEGKLLLIAGELDRNVDPASTMQVVDALVRADKDFDLLVIPGVGHGAAGTAYGQRRLRDFLVRHLHGVEPRWKP
ncbi:MAG: prolyl oligopeptidase family serine peptidase [Planctomycetota bacterium]